MSVQIRVIGEPEEVENFLEDLKEFMEVKDNEPRPSRSNPNEVLVYGEVSL